MLANILQRCYYLCLACIICAILLSLFHFEAKGHWQQLQLASSTRIYNSRRGLLQISPFYRSIQDGTGLTCSTFVTYTLPSPDGEEHLPSDAACDGIM